MSSGRCYAKESKPPTIKPLIISSKELFAKRTRQEKSMDTDSSKAPLTFSPSGSPLAKKVKIDPSVSAAKSDSFMPLAAQGYYMSATPSAFAHLLSDMLLPQSIEALSAKPAGSILDETMGYAFIQSPIFPFNHIFALPHTYVV
ncbi:uncharacterized protein LOC141720571 [Apium graveolens]|uniref:uncharacterized protein LOC141720571 n=1 Tax=Apium graveolens TaxID=4045 RepID=UPI003D798F3C